MKFKVGDKVRIKTGDVVRFKVDDKVVFENDAYGIESFVVESWAKNTKSQKYTYYVNDDWHKEDDLELVTDPLVTKIEERNNKPNILEGKDMNQQIDDPIEPSHYKTGDKDLFDELYDRLYHSKKMFTGREVFIIVMKFVAERYTRRYPNKNPEDLGKGIYTLERLKEYEEMEK